MDRVALHCKNARLNSKLTAITTNISNRNPKFKELQ